MVLPNHSLPQKTAGIFVSRPCGRHGLEEMVLEWESWQESQGTRVAADLKTVRPLNKFILEKIT